MLGLKISISSILLLLAFYIKHATAGIISYHETLLERVDIIHDVDKDNVQLLSLNESFDSTSDGHRLDARREDIDPPPFPNGPLFIGFPPVAKSGLLEATQHAMAEAWAMALFAMRAASCNTPEFQRYFFPADRSEVKNVFQALLGPKGSGPLQMSNASTRLSVLYGDKPVIGEPDYCVAHRLLGWLGNQRKDNTPGSGLILCPELFDIAHTPLTDIECQNLPTFADESLETVSGTILHEFMHWRVLSDLAGVLSIIDYGYSSLRPIQVQGQPPNGYGAYNCQQLRTNGRTPSRNADGYKWFAVEAYFAAQCSGHVFRDAPPPAPNNPAPSTPQDFVDDTDAASSAPSLPASPAPAA